MATVYPTPPGSPLAVQHSPSTSKADIKHLLPHGRTTRTGSSGDLSSPITDSVGDSSLQNHSKQETSRSTEPVDPAALKSLLCISNWRCGYPTTLNAPCKNWILKANRNEVDLKIKIIASLDQSCPELGDELKALAKLVQCRSHRGGHAIDARAKAWLAGFPTGDQGTDPAIYLERELTEALGALSTQCIGEVVTQENCSIDSMEQKRCSLKVGGQKVHNCIRTIGKILTLVTNFGDNREVEYLLKVLERNRQCEDHNESPFEHTSTWYSKILDIQRIYRASVVESLVELTNNDATKPLAGQHRTPDPEDGRSALCISETKAPPLNQGHVESSDSEFPLSWRNVKPAKYWPSAYDESPFENIEKNSKPDEPRSSFGGVLKKAESPLNVAAGDLRDGYVYLYQVKGNEKYVKIGYTTREVDARHKEWEFACNRVPKMVYPEVSVSKRIPNARRVEALCHKELDHCRVKVYCRLCLQEHNEWFEIAATDAVNVIQKWSKWIATDPYEEKMLRSETKWVLKSDQREKIWDMMSI